MLAKRKPIVLLAVFAAAMIVTSDGLARQRYPQDKHSKAARCDLKYINCNHRCDQLVDIGNAVSECKKECDANYGICLKSSGYNSIM